MQFAGFPSIEGFVNVVKLVEAYPHLANKSFTYRGKIKLHGTNAGIRVHKGEVLVQSRENILTPENDHAGFARWVASKLDYWKSICDDSSEELTIFGEWCGPGIMKGTAINQIPNKIFAVFAVMIGGVGFTEDSEFPKEDNNSFVTEPDILETILGNRPSDVFVLPWAKYYPFTIDWSKRETLQPIVDRLNGLISELEPVDPWVKETFGVDGTAEGVVFYPTGPIVRKQFENFAFKVKGEKHKVKKTKEAVQIDPEVAASIDEFIAMFVTEPRCEQGLAAIGGSTEMKNVGPFLKWLAADILKESVAELEASELEWDQVQKAVQNTGRSWFIAKHNII